MNSENLNGKFEMVDVSSIILGLRSRAVNPVQVDALAETFKTVEMLNPITIWQSPDGPYLVAGAHRLAAHKKNGETQIQAKWLNAETLAEVKIFEVSENLGRHDLTVLDRAHHLYDWKLIYEDQNPEIKHGAQGGRGSKRNKEGNLPFSKFAAEKIGMDARNITKSIAMWKGLSPASIVAVTGTKLENHQAGLWLLCHQTRKLQAKVIELMFPENGEKASAANVPDALKILKDGRVYTSQEKRFAGYHRMLKNMTDVEFDIIMSTDRRVMLWVARQNQPDK